VGSSVISGSVGTAGTVVGCSVAWGPHATIIIEATMTMVKIDQNLRVVFIFLLSQTVG
jgi:hypothetical protein